MERVWEKIIYKNEVWDCPICIISDFTFEWINTYTCNNCWFIWKSEDFIRWDDD